MSSVASEATDCSQEGPGLPPKWPYRLVPDRSGTVKLGRDGPDCKSVFSMGLATSIARTTFGLSRGRQSCPAGAPDRQAVA